MTQVPSRFNVFIDGGEGQTQTTLIEFNQYKINIMGELELDGFLKAMRVIRKQIEHNDLVVGDLYTSLTSLDKVLYWKQFQTLIHFRPFSHQAMAKKKQIIRSILVLSWPQI